ncbi:MAG: methyltransferase domain-containing protein [Alphaproteobacteria bacterium]|nr:methyltransferase domain-containing protein [Alphaproteobacteria bacterium]
MAQNVYDNPEFFAGYRQMPRQVKGLDGAPEWPAVRAMLPAMKGLRAVDLGCGFGWVARWMRENGAAAVLGLDLSENMIARAKETTADPAIEYRIADLDTLDLPAGAFDVAFSSLTFHYVADFARLARTLHTALAPGGHLVFTIEHPVYMAAENAQWQADADGTLAWPVNGYSREGERRTDWFAKGVLKHHRTVATTLNALIDAGFAIRRVGEFAPTQEQVAARPDLAKEIERPMFLMVGAQR